jgi:hypothetical protein
MRRPSPQTHPRRLKWPVAPWIRRSLYPDDWSCSGTTGGARDKLGYGEFWCGEHHSSGWEMIASPEMFLPAAGERTRCIKLAAGAVSLPSDADVTPSGWIPVQGKRYASSAERASSCPPPSSCHALPRPLEGAPSSRLRFSADWISPSALSAAERSLAVTGSSLKRAFWNTCSSDWTTGPPAPVISKP